MLTVRKVIKLIELLGMRSSRTISIDDITSKLISYDIFNDLFTAQDKNNISDFDYYKWNDAVNTLRNDFKQYGAEKIARMIYQLSLYYCPIDTGNLREHSKLEKTDTGFRITYDTNYAAYVHEIIDNIHKMPTRAKFLEDAAYEVYNNLQASKEKPLFTFYFGINTDKSIYLDINEKEIDDEQFLKYIDQRHLEEEQEAIWLIQFLKPNEEIIDTKNKKGRRVGY